MKKEKIRILIKNNEKTKKLYNFLKQIYFSLLNVKIYLFSILFSFYKIKNNKIVISNYNGRGYGDNLKYIHKELEKEEYDIVWLVDFSKVNVNEFPETVRLVKMETIKALYELVTARVWIDNTRKRFMPLKRKGQIYIQTWHAGIGMKRVGKLVGKKEDPEGYRIFKKDVKNTDLILSNSKYATDCYRNDFQYSGEILETGIPRNDILVSDNEELKNKIKKKLQLERKKIILYAPTFRRNSSIEVYNLEYEKLKNAVSKKFGGDWIVLLRLHPYISTFSKQLENEITKNVTDYSDLTELLLISDIVISDYSSLVFDFIETGNPCFLYAPDFDEYYEKYGLTFSEKELPFDIARDNDELVLHIEKFDYMKYKTNITEFLNKNVLNETGNSSKDVCRYIKEKIEKYNG